MNRKIRIIKIYLPAISDRALFNIKVRKAIDVESWPFQIHYFANFLLIFLLFLQFIFTIIFISDDIENFTSGRNHSIS